MIGRWYRSDSLLVVVFPGILMLALAGLGGWRLQQDQKLSVPGEAIVLTPDGPAPPSAPSERDDQKLETTVQDPGHPEEPWVVTTYRRDGESLGAFIKRHRELVDAVREALGT